jgi:hypothetical protein
MGSLGLGQKWWIAIRVNINWRSLAFVAVYQTRRLTWWKEEENNR